MSITLKKVGSDETITGDLNEEGTLFTTVDGMEIQVGKDEDGKYINAADGSKWEPMVGGRKRRSSKKSKKGGNKHTMTMGGKKSKKSKKGGKKSKKSRKH